MAASSSVQSVKSLPRPDVVLPATGVVVGETFVFAGVVVDPILVRVALVVHLVTFLGCVLAPLREEGPASPGLFFAFSLLPLSRLVFSGLPMITDVGVFQFALLYIALAPAALMVVRMDSTPTPEPRWETLQEAGPFFLPLAVVLGLAGYLAIDPSPIIPSTRPAWLLLSASLFLGVVGPLEELVFRGILQANVQAEIGRGYPILLSGGLYGAFHSQYGSLSAMWIATLTGLFLGYLYAHSESLGLVAVLNGVIGFCTFVAFPMWL